MQTDETALFPRLTRREHEGNGVRLDARRLVELRAGLPDFTGVDAREGLAPPPVAVAVAIVGAEIPL